MNDKDLILCAAQRLYIEDLHVAAGNHVSKRHVPGNVRIDRAALIIDNETQIAIAVGKPTPEYVEARNITIGPNERLVLPFHRHPDYDMFKEVQRHTDFELLRPYFGIVGDTLGPFISMYSTDIKNARQRERCEQWGVVAAHFINSFYSL